MYLRRFGIPKSGGNQLIATDVDQDSSFPASVNKVAVETGFYWGTDLDGVPHHDMEKLLTAVEAAATPAFHYLLDQGRDLTDDALPQLPIRPEFRLAMSWWIAAQLLRTPRQRDRLLALHEEPAEVPTEVKAETHLTYILQLLAPIAGVIFRRPWGFGVTSLCLVTSDTPVLILNGQDERDQLTAAAFWDIYLPLDPHRMLLLPGHLHRDNWRLAADHRFTLPGGVALPLNDMQASTATRHIFSHPNHDAWKERLNPHPRLGNPSEARTDLGVIIQYDALQSGFGVERRWLDEHPKPEDHTGEADELTSDADALKLVEQLSARLEKSQATYRAFDQ